MKKSRIFTGISALVLAIAGITATRASSSLVSQDYTTTTAGVTTCHNGATACTAGSNTCTQTINGKTATVFQETNTSCLNVMSKQ